MNSGGTRPDCSKCRHFFVTWEAWQPRGCRAYGFKSREWPNLVVERSSGTPCGLFEARQPPAGPARGRVERQR